MKMEMKMKQTNDEVLKISGMFRNWQETLQGPQQKFDAQIFTLKNVVKESEQERESEFALLQNTMKKVRTSVWKTQLAYRVQNQLEVSVL